MPRLGFEFTPDVRKQQFIQSLIVWSIIASVVGILAFVPIPSANQDAFNLMLGFLFGVATTVAAFTWPSNVESGIKNDTIANLAAKTPPTDIVTRTTVETSTDPTVPTESKQ